MTSTGALGAFGFFTTGFFGALGFFSLRSFFAIFFTIQNQISIHPFQIHSSSHFDFIFSYSLFTEMLLPLNDFSGNTPSSPYLYCIMFLFAVRTVPSFTTTRSLSEFASLLYKYPDTFVETPVSTSPCLPPIVW